MTPRSVVSLLCAVATFPMLLACPPRQPPTSCTANDECDDGFECRNGACVDPNAPVDAGDADGGDTDGGDPNTDGGGNPDTDGGDDDGGNPNTDGGDGDGGVEDGGSDGGQGGLCPHNNDGILTEAELPLSIGIQSRFVEAQIPEDEIVPVDLAGDVDADGNPVWHFDTILDSDAEVEIGALPISDFWFEDEPAFSDATYVAPLDGSSENYGIFTRTDTELLMLGVASDEPELTLITYDPPLTALVFPMEVGTTFSDEISASGTFEGNSFYFSTDTYNVEVDARGTAVTPAGSFDVLRLRIEQNISVPILVFPFSIEQSHIRYSFLTPCLGQVVAVSSVDGETDPLYTEASELRRVGFLP